MTGTSMDGLDISVVELEGYGLDLKVKDSRNQSFPLGKLSEKLRAISLGKSFTIKDLVEINHHFSHLHLDALKEMHAENAHLIAIHGQTLYHKPPLSLQMLNPNLIAHNLKVPVVYDLRAADLSMGGEGAPMTPLSDAILFRSPAQTRGIVNLGGFCNITKIAAMDQVDRNEISAKDLCACNHILDSLAREMWGFEYDHDGQKALEGKVNPEIFEQVFTILSEQNQTTRSLGSGDELYSSIRGLTPKIASQDLARSIIAAMALLISESLKECAELILAGGGAHNQALVAEIKHFFAGKVYLSDDFNIPIQYRESISMAILGALCEDRIPITLAQVTHCHGEAPVAGVWVQPK
ncbi:MAG: anhydro-N-acetylmuramic acid kinase [Planctomycetes bacterium]|nr:anhydro-N-acetylmuramic acid kinase [Planctomycetota bacterium]